MTDKIAARDKRVKRALLHAAVDNLLDVPADHPAFEPSLKLITDFYFEQHLKKVGFGGRRFAL